MSEHCARCFVRTALTHRAGKAVCKSCSFQLDQATAFYEYYGWVIVDPATGDLPRAGEEVEVGQLREKAPETKKKAPKAT